MANQQPSRSLSGQLTLQFCLVLGCVSGETQFLPTPLFALALAQCLRPRAQCFVLAQRVRPRPTRSLSPNAFRPRPTRSPSPSPSPQLGAVMRAANTPGKSFFAPPRLHAGWPTIVVAAHAPPCSRNSSLSPRHPLPYGYAWLPISYFLAPLAHSDIGCMPGPQFCERVDFRNLRWRSRRYVSLTSSPCLFRC